MANLSGWTESIVLVSAFVVVLTIVVAGFNVLYNQNYTVPIIDNNTQQLINYQTAAHSQLQQSDVVIGTVNGITVKSSYDILMGLANSIWSFLSGGWIPNLGVMLRAGEAGMALAHALQVIWVLSLILGILYALWRVPV